MPFFLPSDTSPDERRRILAWQMYDWANSVFATIILAACLPIYFTHVALAGHNENGDGQATALWGWTVAASMALVAVVALILGPVSDATARKKRFLGIFILMGCAATALLALCPPGAWRAVSLLFILGNAAFAAGNIFYDALLPAVAKPRDLDRVSSGGYALGYLGGGLLLAIVIGMIFLMPTQTIEATGVEFPVLTMQIAFVVTAAWWLAFSLPLFRHVPEPPVAHPDATSALRLAFRRLAETAGRLREMREALKFLVAFWLFSDGLGTIIKMAAVYGAEIFEREGLGAAQATAHLLAALLMVQFVGVPFTMFWARVADRIGAKASVMICLCIYAGICVLGFFMKEIWHFYALGFGVAVVQGGTQALSRSMYATLLPKGKEAEFFGFYNISGKFAGIVGPAIFAVVAGWTGEGRLAILSLIVFFIAGGAVLAFVRFPDSGRSRHLTPR